MKDQIDQITKSALENDKCYLMDSGSEVFVWVGRSTSVDERKAATKAAEVSLGFYIFFLPETKPNKRSMSHLEE